MEINIPAFIEWCLSDPNIGYIISAAIGGLVPTLLAAVIKLFTHRKGSVKAAAQLVKQVSADGKIDSNDLTYVEQFLNEIKR